MISLMQFAGVMFALGMGYFTHLYYRRREYPLTDYVAWQAIWTAILLLAVFPEQTLGLIAPAEAGATQAIAIAAYALMLAILHFQHTQLRRNQRMLATIVRDITLKDIRMNQDKKR